MRKGQKVRPVVDVVILLACAVGMAACQLELSKTEGQPPEAQGAAAAQQSESGLVIENDSELPDTYPHGSYELRFRAHGGVSVLHWRLQKGSLPPGMKLEDDGLLHGQEERSGEFQFTVSVTDARPQQGVQKGFVLRVRSALTLNWKAPARVNGNRIEGSVEVSNATPIGYQHFVLRRGTVAKELPFGETLPSGGYVVHVDAVGEVVPKTVIYRERRQTPSALQVTVGP